MSGTTQRGTGRIGSAGAALLLACGGCPPEAKPPPAPRQTEAVVLRYNANALGFGETIRAKNVSVAMKLRDAQGTRRRFDLSGVLWFQPPRRLYLSLKQFGPVLQIGSNEQEYWVWWIEPRRQMWWGRYEHLGKPCAEAMPIRPDHLLAMLGITPLPTGEGALLGPLRQVRDAEDTLIYFRWPMASRRPTGDGVELLPADPSAEPPGRIQREYWLDRYPPFVPRRILFRDAIGDVLTEARLSDHEPVGENGPLLAREITVTLPQVDGWLRMRLGRASFRGDYHPKLFERPRGARLMGSEAIQVDAACEIPTTRPLE